MLQYNKIKSEHQDCLLLFRMGDFYEFFHDDAVIASKLLGITLTSRNSKGKIAVKLAGFPYHSLERYAPILVRSGNKIAICEQLELPTKGKTIVKREVVEIITRGTTLDANCLESKRNNYLAAINYNAKSNQCGLSYLDLSTGNFSLTEGHFSQVLDEIVRLGVGEVLISSNSSVYSKVQKSTDIEKQLLTSISEMDFDNVSSIDSLKRHFKVISLEAFGIQEESLAVGCAGSILNYVLLMKKTELSHLVKLQWKNLNEYMNLDQSSVRNLEIISTLNHDDKEETLYRLLNRTLTPMGSRLLYYWLVHPLKNLQVIQTRQKAIQFFLNKEGILDRIRESLNSIDDVERLSSKIGSQRAHSRDLLSLGKSLIQIVEVVDLMSQTDLEIFSSLKIDSLLVRNWGENICNRFLESPPLSIKEGGMLNPNYYPEISKILEDSKEGRNWFNDLEKTLKQQTKIPKLKVSFNRIFGYFVEVSNQYTALIPDYFIPKQSLTSATRYTTVEMKEWEIKVLQAKEKVSMVEYRLFCELRDELSLEIPNFLQLSEWVAKVDVLYSFSEYALATKSCLPTVNYSDMIEIKEGRHPVVESLIEEGQYISNDITMDCDSRQILLMTGPNMAGKSTYLRQTALIVLMAQVGSFVPAESAKIGIVDAIFTRVGASDRLAQGKSTFMVEMLETAAILNNATPQSLILLDEVGRGTSTYDGLSLAQSIVEEIHNNSKVASKTLFATHYHELTDLSRVLPRVINLQILIKEIDEKLVFLRKVVEGKCDSSYGIQVATMAGIPKQVTIRAKEILATLEDNSYTLQSTQNEKSFQSPLLSKLDVRDQENLKWLEQIKKIDLNVITPLDLMQRIQDLKSKLQ